MIKSFRHKGLKQLFETGSQRGITPQASPRLLLIMDAIDVAENPGELNLPGFHLHELKGNRKGTWSIRVTGNLRITFRFEAADALDLDLEDYH
jgi:proteic killer suppression protein